MKFRIHFTITKDDDEFDDSIIVEGDDIDELKKKANEEVSKRNGKDPWSEEII